MEELHREPDQETLTIQARMLERMSEGVALLNDRGVILFTNRAFDTMFGYGGGELLNRSCFLLNDYPPDENLERIAHIRQALHSDGAWIGELRSRKKDGTPFLTEARISTLEMSGQVYWVSVQQDITERKRLEERLRQAQKMEAIGRLAGGIAHDFNNLLTGILGYSQIRLNSLEREDPGREELQEILRLGERAAGLTRQLLAFSRKQILEFQVVDLNAVVVEMEKLLQRLIGEDIELITVLDPALHQVKADTSQMEQVIVNLAVNARDAMPRGGRLTIHTSNVEVEGPPPGCVLRRACGEGLRESAALWPGSYVKLAVSDTGCGMDEHTREHLFEPFFTTKPVTAGTGLGLATVYGILQQSGGSIDVLSAVGQGTTFELYLPRTGEPVARLDPPAKPMESRGGQETVLVLEDEPSVLSLVRKILERSGYGVLEASSSSEALQIGEQFSGSIELLVADIVMPKMSGCEVAERLAKLRPRMKVLFLSGYTDDTVLRHGVRLGTTPFLQKPFSPSSLVHKIREVLDEAGADVPSPYPKPLGSPKRSVENYYAGSKELH